MEIKWNLYSYAYYENVKATGRWKIVETDGKPHLWIEFEFDHIDYKVIWKGKLFRKEKVVEKEITPKVEFIHEGRLSYTIDYGVNDCND